MSFSDKIQTAIDLVIRNYVNEVAVKFNLDQSELLSLWDNKTRNVSVVPHDPGNASQLLKLPKAELVELCKARSLHVSGSKQDLVDRLCGTKSANTKTPKLKQTTLTKTSTPASGTASVLKKITENIPSIEIRRNKFDNFEHKETRFVFNNKTQKVYGKQNDDGTISPLTKEDINVCNKYKFSYYIPDNLNTGKESDDEDIEDEVEVVNEVSDVEEPDDYDDASAAEEEEYDVEEEEYYVDE